MMTPPDRGDAPAYYPAALFRRNTRIHRDHGDAIDPVEPCRSHRMNEPSPSRARENEIAAAVCEQQRAEDRPLAFRIGPADELVAVQANARPSPRQPRRMSLSTITGIRRSIPVRSTR